MDDKKAIETRDALMFKFGVEDPNKLHPRLSELHDITFALANAADTERDELIEKIKEWYKLCDW